jgi:hypothetical protein
MEAVAVYEVTTQAIVQELAVLRMSLVVALLPIKEAMGQIRMALQGVVVLVQERVMPM